MPIVQDNAGNAPHSWRCAGRWQAARIDSLFDSFVPTVETFHPTKHCSMTWGSTSTHGSQPTNLPSTRSTCPTFVHDSHLPLSTDRRNHPAKGNPRYPLLPSTGWLFNYNFPTKCTIFEQLGISIHTLNKVSIIYKKSPYKLKWITIKKLKIIQGDQKVSVQLMITIQKDKSNVQSVPYQGQGDTRLILTPSVTPNSNSG